MLMDVDKVQDAGSVDRLMTELLFSARKLFGMEVAFISEFQDGQRIFRYVDAQEGVELIQVNGFDSLEESYCQRIVDGRLPELIQDATRNPEAIYHFATDGSFFPPVGDGCSTRQVHQAHNRASYQCPNHKTFYTNARD